MKFNEDVYNYDIFRPRYCDKLFEDIINQYIDVVDEGVCVLMIGESLSKKFQELNAVRPVTEDMPGERF